jgi:choloylglycine hydrolase
MKSIFGVFFLAVMIFLQTDGSACTNFQIQAEDGTIVVARSNEFAIPTHSQIVFEPAGKKFTSKAPNGQEGYSWTSRYAFLGVNGLGLQENFADGMNEAGLSAQGLMFLESQYETIHDPSHALSCNDFVAWILSNFSNVDELKKELPNFSIWGDVVSDTIGTLPLHFAIHDASGNCLVVEFIQGSKKIYDHPLGVMTNMPELPWQITNLREYLNLNPFNPNPKNFNSVPLLPTGQGSGWLGLPGGWSPPSRFVRIANLVFSAASVKNTFEALNLAKHILNTVDIPLGCIEYVAKGGSIKKEFTQWSLLMDLSHQMFYYYSYDDQNLKSIDLKKLALKKNKCAKSIAISEEFFAEDVSEKMHSF